MSRSLSFEYDAVDQPAAVDPVERATWCALRIRVGDRSISRVYDRTLQSERTTLYVPAFPIAEWLVHNWWIFRNEPCRTEKVPAPHELGTQLGWIKRHCLRAADSALMLPSLYLYHDGRELRAVWQPDEPGTMPNMLGQFVSWGDEPLDDVSTCESLGNFIGETLDRVSKLDDGRVRELRLNWQAIQVADREEQEFCAITGRMGIDPYDREALTDEVAEFLEAINPTEKPIVRDLTEVATTTSVIGQWSWVHEVSMELGLTPTTVVVPVGLPHPGSSPPRFGYSLARTVRDHVQLPPALRIDSVEAIAMSATERPFRVVERNHVEGAAIRAIVGQSGHEIVSAGPMPVRNESRRFLIARSLYHAIVTTVQGVRLVTNAFTWHQKASRAFAAELLAPQGALLARLEDGAAANPDVIEQMSKDFEVSAMVIEKQLENAGAAIVRE
ncbi:MAG TPA: hypothetical protein VMF30_03510 [Pirellulales bacterium]|nr:hypothetical protein [Pirellulales bacterium]